MTDDQDDREFHAWLHTPGRRHIVNSATNTTQVLVACRMAYRDATARERERCARVAMRYEEHCDCEAAANIAAAIRGSEVDDDS